jgi:hypothetical protein
LHGELPVLGIDRGARFGDAFREIPHGTGRGCATG